MEYFVNSLKILGMDIIPVIVTIIIYFIFHKFNALKNLNKWWKEIIIGAVFSALTILSYVLAIQIGVIESKTSYVSNGTLMPLLACLIFGWPSGVMAAIAGALYRGLAFNDYLRISVVISLFFSAIVGTLARLFLFKDKRTKWYNAALLGAFVETFNFLMIFVIARDTSEAYTVLSVIDIFCILGAIVTLSLAMASVNIIDKKVFKVSNVDKNLSRSIATKVQHRLFIVTFATLIVVSTSSYFINARKSKEDIKDQLLLSSQNILGRFELRYGSNTYSFKQKGEYIYEYNTLCEKQTILEKGYTIIVSANVEQIFDCDHSEPGKGITIGQIISTNSLIAESSQKADCIFKFDDGTNLFGRPDEFYSSEEKTNLFITKIHKIDYYCAVYPLKAYSNYGTRTYIDFFAVCLANKEEVDSSTGISLKIAIYTQILAFIFLFASVNFLLRKIVISKIYQVNSSLEKITNGDLNEVVKASGSKEIERLSNRINLTVDSLKLYAKKVEQKIEEDLALAKKIQTTSVPTLFPLVKHYEIYATMHTAKEVGGDFYDYVTIDDNHVLFLVADVSGKGIPAALFMMRAKTLIKSLVSTGIPLEYVVKRANDELCSENTAGLFVTMWIGILDTRNGQVTYVNCGHCPPIVRLDGQYSYIRARKNFVLGAIDGFDFKSDTITLGIDDLLLLYTDGVTEATNKNLELYGEDRLLKFVSNSSAVFDCHQLLERLNDEIDRYQKDIEQADDITMLAVTYRGNVNDSESREITLRSRSEDTVAAINFVKTFMYKNRADENKIKECINAVDEVYTNISKYAYPKRIGYVKVKVEIKNKVISISFTDKGPAFDPTKGVDKNNKEGLGLIIIKKCVDKMSYKRNKNENILILEKNI